ncbi:MAG: hypothetical protein ACREO3_00640 [Arenimonas sp.]
MSFTKHARIGGVLLVAALLAACAHHEVLTNDGLSVSVRQMVDCGKSTAGHMRWRLLELRVGHGSRLRIEQSRLGADGSWRSSGAAIVDPSAEDGVPRKLRGLRCEIVGEGLKVNAGAEDRHQENMFHLEVIVHDDLTTEIKQYFLS